MRWDSNWPHSRLHLDPLQVELVLDAELGLRAGNDVARYVCGVMQHTVERMVSGALASSDLSKLREVESHSDIQTRHIQYYMRSDEKIWSLFNSTFILQVILSTFLDPATEALFRRLSLPIHDRDALTNCEFYNTAVATVKPRMKQKKRHDNRNAVDIPSLTTPALLARVAAGVNPLCSLSPKACSMTGALIHEVFVALFERVIQSKPDIRVITIFDVEGGILRTFPADLATEVTLAGERTLAKHNASLDRFTDDGEHSGNVAYGEDDEVRVCIHHLKGTRTTLKKTFKLAPQCLLFALFERAYDRLRMTERSVVFVQDGFLLSGECEARTLGFQVGCPAVQVFAVCKTAWASKQRGLARRGWLTDPSDAFHSTKSTRVSAAKRSEDVFPGKQSANNLSSLRTIGSQRYRHPSDGATATVSHRHATKNHTTNTHAHYHTSGGPVSSVQPSPSASRVLPPLPADVQLAAALRDNLSERRRRSRGRGIETSIEENTLDPNHLKSGRPVPPRPAPCALDSRLSQGASRGLLALSRSDTAQASTGTGGESGSGMAVLERAVSRLIDTEACLKAVDDSIQDLRSGDKTSWPSGWPTGVPDLALAAMTTQLRMACDMSSLCRQALSAAHQHDEVPEPRGIDSVSRRGGRLTMPDGHDNIGDHGNEGELGGKGGQGEHTSNVGGTAGKGSTDHQQQGHAPLLPPHAEVERASSGRGTYGPGEERLDQNGLGGDEEPGAIREGSSMRLAGASLADVDAATAASAQPAADMPPGKGSISEGMGESDRESNAEVLQKTTVEIEQSRPEKQPQRQENSTTLFTGADEHGSFEAENVLNLPNYVEPEMQGELESESRWSNLDHDLDLGGREDMGESYSCSAPTTLDQVLADGSPRADIGRHQAFGSRGDDNTGDRKSGPSATLDQLLAEKSAHTYTDRRQGHGESNHGFLEDALSNRQIDTSRKTSMEPRKKSRTSSDVDAKAGAGAPYTLLEISTPSMSHVTSQNRSETGNSSMSQNRDHQLVDVAMPADSTGARAIDLVEGAKPDCSMLAGKGNGITADAATLPTNHDGLPGNINPLLLAIDSGREEAKCCPLSIGDPLASSSYSSHIGPTTASKEGDDPYDDDDFFEGGNDDDGGNWSTWLPQASP